MHCTIRMPLLVHKATLRAKSQQEWSFPIKMLLFVRKATLRAGS